jgi:bacterioferritin-associated ferredoxin
MPRRRPRRNGALGAGVKVCICHDVSDHLVRERARAGVSLEAVLAETGAGSGCGKCILAIARIHAGAEAVLPPCARAGRSRQAA